MAFRSNGLRLRWLFGALLALHPESRSIADTEDAMRCGNVLVRLGSTEAKVRECCGAPASAEERNVEWKLRGILHRMRVSTWTYRMAGSFVRTLTFEDGTLQRIDAGGHS
jgi:hypothetical protein